MSSPILVFNRKTQRLEEEQVYGDTFVKFLYETRSGQFAADRLLAQPFFSRCYGRYQSSSLSRRKLPAFIRDFKIDMSDYEEGPFRSFNDFFIRRFKENKRPVEPDPRKMAAFAEARYFGYESVINSTRVPVKGEYLSPQMLLGADHSAVDFEGGPLLLARLCPVDYHRFHYPDDGVATHHSQIAGQLHSVNPIALRYKGEIFGTNERQVTLLQTQNFGKIAYIEVGALCVGLIVQSHPKLGGFKRGEEKGYFLFGASTVIVLGQKGAWKPSADILAQTQQGRETLVRLGEEVATRIQRLQRPTFSDNSSMSPK